MLYATTRSHNETYTAHKAIHSQAAPDGGLFVPFRMPFYEEAAIVQMMDQSFGQNVATVLEDLFGLGLTGWDVEFSIGRSPVKLVQLNPRATVAELWHNTGRDYSFMVQGISDRLRREGHGETATEWTEVAVTTAVIFGLYGEFLKQEGQLRELDVAVPTGDFTFPIACWYAKGMGLSLGNILCGCNGNGGLWSLVNHGSLPTGESPVQTLAPLGDMTVPAKLERLIHGLYGPKEVDRFLDRCRWRGTYNLPETGVERLKRDFFVAVISDSRIQSIIRQVYNTTGFLFGPYSALAYGSLMDYRATRNTLLISPRSPVLDADTVSACTELTAGEISAVR